MLEPGHAPRRCIRGELGRATTAFDRPSDDRVALPVSGERALVPVGGGDRVAEVCDGVAFAREHVDVEVECLARRARRTRSGLVDEVDREPVRPGRDRRANRDVERGAAARLEPRPRVRSPSQTIALPSSSSQWYETVKRSPRHGVSPTFSSSTRAVASAPAWNSGSSWAPPADARAAVPSTTSLGRPWNRSSCAPPGASRSSARRSGSCVRRAARCRSTARSARRHALRRRRATPSSAPR